jgi:pyruvate/2-oxoglutarate dehydrogenase complex dihydrolipoamide dehydrogenase (E3) component
MRNKTDGFDIAVIGAGTAGLVSAFLADSLGARVALVEKHRVGGECLWTGCVPSKTLIKAARVYDTVKRAEEFGIHVENARVRWNAVQLRIAAVRDEIRELERNEISKTQIEIIHGAARFEDASTLRVTNADGEQTIRAKKFILACGTRPRIPEIEGLSEIGFLTHEQIFDMKNLPRSWIILGGGPVGCEMAQALARLDCRVTLLQRASTLLPREDADVSAACEKILRNEGVKVFCNVDVRRAKLREEKKRLEFQVGDETHSASAAEVLVAVGKQTDLEALNAGAAGIEWDARGVSANAYLQAAPNVWACGDVTGKLLFTHVAEAQAKVAAQNALLPIKKKWDERVLPWCTFLDPEIARVGLSEDEARREYSDIKVYRQEFAKLDRAIIEGEASGFLKVIATSSGRVLGAHLVGPSAGELIHQFVAAVRDGVLISEFAETIHVYPTLSEVAHRAGNEYFQDLLQNRWIKAALEKFVA